MASNQDSGEKSRIAANIPTNQKEALFLLAKAKSQERRENVSQAEIIRDYVAEGLAREDDLPPEARELLDDGLIADENESAQSDGGVADA
jgi:hypothetical protein